MSDLPTIFHSAIASAVDADGVYPHQAIRRLRNGTYEMLALAVPSEQAGRMIVELARRDDTAELIYGFDRYTKPGQGTEFADCIAGAWLSAGRWHPLVISYRPTPRLVLPIDWGNPFWTNAIRHELAQLGWGGAVEGRA